LKKLISTNQKRERTILKKNGGKRKMKDINKKIMSIALCMLFFISFLPAIDSLEHIKDIESNRSLFNFNNESYNLNGNILYVGGIGSGNYSKIQDALDSANDGDIIYVFNGTYYEWLIIDKSIKLIGEIDENGNRPWINAGEDNDIIKVESDGCIIENFCMRNGPSGYGNEAIILYSNNNIIDNCYFIETGKGIVGYNSSNNIIKNNIQIDGWRGIYLSSSKNNTLRNNEFYNIARTIHLHNESNNNYILNNIIKNSITGSGILSTTSNSNYIINNYFMNNNDGIILGGFENTFSNNILINDFLDFTDDWYSQTIYNNTINNKPLTIYKSLQNENITSDYGQLILIDCNNITIKNITTENGLYIINSLNIKINNCIIKSYQHGCSKLLFKNSSNNEIIENNISNNGIIIDNQSNNNIIRNNNLQNTHRGIEVAGKYNIIINNNISSSSKYVTGISIRNSNNEVSFNYINSLEYGIACSKSENVTIKNNRIETCKYGIYTSRCNSCSITNNIIIDCKIGLGLHNSLLKIKNNMISNNTIGIKALGAANFIILNHIQGNEIGLKLSSDSFSMGCGNIIWKNNFIDNDVHAFFEESYLNMWIQNYWGRPFLSPKLISGLFIIRYGYSWGGGVISIPWINIDLRPALKPHNIPNKTC
jgi:parallel beta-helix repeat protein